MKVLKQKKKEAEAKAKLEAEEQVKVEAEIKEAVETEKPAIEVILNETNNAQNIPEPIVDKVKEEVPNVIQEQILVSAP